MIPVQSRPRSKFGDSLLGFTTTSVIYIEDQKFFQLRVATKGRLSDAREISKVNWQQPQIQDLSPLESWFGSETLWSRSRDLTATIQQSIEVQRFGDPMSSPSIW
ncbi:hypothetical protein AVEN_270491-1 [Araneus ventricosus]|uniref:Uncharacterized protein n=1 Tax=Araneus ventricosus TaxID=182803 RepID=A0A4Y2B790_ARAVE|nr:hypothetical protein AVEN_270491-1 [Araneus ventricosus]